MKDTPGKSLLLKILLMVGVITLAGAIGFYGFERDAYLLPGSPRSVTLSFGDCLWWAVVTVTTIGYGDIYPVTVGGRIVAVVLMFGGIGALGVSTAAIAAHFVENNRLELLRLRRLRDHVVICGLGEKGRLLAKEFSADGYRVVVVERDANNPAILPCRNEEIAVVVGDAADPQVLQAVQVREAKYLIAVCGEDATNAAIATHARELARARTRSVLTCSVHIVDPTLCFLLRQWEIAGAREVAAGGAFRLEFFNVHDIGARALLQDYPPFPSLPASSSSGAADAASPAAPPPAAPPHLLVVGGGKLGQSLILHAMQRWRERWPTSQTIPSNEKLYVTLIDTLSAFQSIGPSAQETLELRYPELESVCDLQVHRIALESIEFRQGSLFFSGAHRPPLTIVYVCLEEDTVSLASALTLYHHLVSPTIPVIVKMTRNSGLTMLLGSTSGQSAKHRALHAVGLLERTCQPELILGGINEVLARAAHEEYVQERKEAGAESAANSLLVKWEALPEEMRESNRRQADFIKQKLEAIDYDITPLTSWNSALHEFSSAEIERMAEMEHDRWMNERLRAGWRPGPRDIHKKTNPNLVAWEQLSEEGREQNRHAARQLPLFLARIGFEAYSLQDV